MNLSRRKLGWFITLVALVALAVAGYFFFAHRAVQEEVTATEPFASIVVQEQAKLNFNCSELAPYAVDLANGQLKSLVDAVREKKTSLREALTPEIKAIAARLNDLMLKCQAIYNIAIAGQPQEPGFSAVPEDAQTAASRIYAVVSSGVGADCDAGCEGGLVDIIDTARQTLITSLRK